MIYADIGRMKLGIMFTRSKYDKDKPTKPRNTTCLIVELLPDSVKDLMSAEAKCGRRDTFNKEMGRKIALARTICQHVYHAPTKTCKKCHGTFSHYLTLRLSKAERLAIWRAYFAKAKAPRLPNKEDLVLTGDTPPENQHGLSHAGMD